MTKHIIWRYVLVITIVLAGLPILAQDTDEVSDEPLVVAIKTFEPFVMQSGENWTGFSIQLWENIAREIGRDFEYIVVESVTDQLQTVEDGTADVAIAGISITSEREERIDFSQPFFDAGLQIMAPRQRSLSIIDLLMVLLSPTMLQVFGFFFAFIIIAAHVVRVLERNKNPDFPTPYLKGIGEALWWSVVTVTTVGYGDKSPKGASGRIFGVIWMMMGLFLIANFTAGVTSAITLQELRGSINNLSDLQGSRVGTVAGSTSIDFLQNAGFSPSTYDTIDLAYDALEAERIDAIVYDAPILLYYANNGGNGQFEVVGDTFNIERYGIAFPQDSPLQEEVNRALLNEVESGRYDGLVRDYFGS